MASSCLWWRKLISYSGYSENRDRGRLKCAIIEIFQLSPNLLLLTISSPKLLRPLLVSEHYFFKKMCDPFPFYGKHLYVQSCAPLEDTVQRNIPFPLRVGHPRASVPDCGRNGRKLFISPPDPSCLGPVRPRRRPPPRCKARENANPGWLGLRRGESSLMCT